MRLKTAGMVACVASVLVNCEQIRRNQNISL